jgi:hypothetical protein
LRVANNLEKGAEELVADKPAIVFVQPHLSGLSAEIILMHLKKQLGRKRTRFVLLATPAQAGSDTVRLYQGHVDTSLDDETLFNSIKDVIATLLTKNTRKITVDTLVSETVSVEPSPPLAEAVPDKVPMIVAPLQEIDEPSERQPEEPSLVDQGITYAPRQRMSVYSEFNSSFDSAVSSIKPAVTLAETVPEQNFDWHNNEIETIEPTVTRSKQAIFLLWLAPVVIAVIVITLLQHKRSIPVSTESSQKTQTPLVVSPKPERISDARKQQPDTSVVPVQIQKPALSKSSNEPGSPLSDKAVLSAIAENRDNNQQTKVVKSGSRLTALPDFIPRNTLDKAYTSANPGWERYKGYVTEFKVFREGNSIKAIQVIDRGGRGVPESFMKAALRQVSKTPAFVLESSEKKEGYEIQRGHTAENLKVMYYRDDQGGKLRAFVLTWQ